MSVQPYEAPAVPALVPQHTVDLAQWAQEASAVHQIAKALANTSFVPRALQNRPDEIAAQILYGRDVNLPPMVALSHINIIEGRPSLSALSMRGLAQNRGVRFRIDESTETRCRMSAYAPGDADWTTVLWTMDRAKKLGVAGKSNWTKQPQAMLIARATSELCRLVAAPLFLGLSYSTEELKDGVLEPLDTAVAEQPAAPKAAEPAQRILKRDAPVRVQAEVQKDRPPVGYANGDVPHRPPGEKVERPDMVSDGVRKALMVAFREADVHDRRTRLAYVSDVLGREVDSVNQITDEEGKRILDQIAKDNLKPVDAQELPQDGGWADTPVREVPS